jgi:hypothetical protein
MSHVILTCGHNNEWMAHRKHMADGDAASAAVALTISLAGVDAMALLGQATISPRIAGATSVREALSASEPCASGIRCTLGLGGVRGVAHPGHVRLLAETFAPVWPALIEQLAAPCGAPGGRGAGCRPAVVDPVTLALPSDQGWAHSPLITAAVAAAAAAGIGAAAVRYVAVLHRAPQPRASHHGSSPSRRQAEAEGPSSLVGMVVMSPFVAALQS